VLFVAFLANWVEITFSIIQAAPILFKTFLIYDSQATIAFEFCNVWLDISLTVDQLMSSCAYSNINVFIDVYIILIIIFIFKQKPPFIVNFFPVWLLFSKACHTSITVFTVNGITTIKERASSYMRFFAESACLFVKIFISINNWVLPVQVTIFIL
jgi:hypothetical protein